MNSELHWQADADCGVLGRARTARGSASGRICNGARGLAEYGFWRRTVLCRLIVAPMLTTRRSFLLAAAASAFWPGVARGKPGRVLLVGDSMIAGAFGLYLEQHLRKAVGHEVERRGKSSSGLARPDFFDWLEEGERLRTKFSPDAVVVMFGGNDGQGLYMGRGAEPKWIRWHEDGWTEEYRRRVNAFADVMTANGEQIFWVGMPVMKPTKLNARVDHMNTIYRAEMAIRPHAEFVDVWRLLAGPDGGYAHELEVAGKRVRIRASDGVHLSGAGAKVLVEHVAGRISRRMDA